MKKLLSIFFMICCFSFAFSGCENSVKINGASITEITSTGSKNYAINIAYFQDSRLENLGTDVQLRFNKTGEVVFWEDNGEKQNFVIDEFDTWYSLTNLIAIANGQEGKENFVYFKDALKLDATNEYFFLWVGISYIQIAKNNNDYNIALDYLFKALAFRNYLAYEYISYCYIKLENYKDALIYLEKSIEYNGNDYSTRYYLFYVYFILRNYDEALYHLKISIELKKDEFDSWFMLGILYKIRGEDKKLYRRAFSNARKIAIHCNDDSLTVVYLEKLMKADVNNYFNYLKLYQNT